MKTNRLCTLLVFPLLLAACAPLRPPKPPTPPPVETFLLRMLTTPREAGAMVRNDMTPSAFSPNPIWVAKEGAAFDGLTRTDFNVCADAPGYEVLCKGVGDFPLIDGVRTIDFQLKAKPVPWLQPVSTDALRLFRGDFGGINVPEIKPQCPVDPRNDIHCVDNARGFNAGNLFTPAYTIYTESQRTAIRSAYAARRYTHYPISIFNEQGRGYSGILPEGPKTNINTLLKELWLSKLFPVCYALHDNEDADAAERNAARLEDRRLCPIVVVKWEMNGPDQNNTARMNREIIATRQAFPRALLYVHFTAQHGAGGSPESAWWNGGWRKGSTWTEEIKNDRGDVVEVRTYTHDDDWPGAAQVGVRGMLIQDDRWDNPQAVIERVSDFLSRFGAGMNQWPKGLDAILYETDIFSKFWEGRTEAQGLDYNDIILQQLMMTPFCDGSYCGRLLGFASGSRLTYPGVPPPLN